MRARKGRQAAVAADPAGEAVQGATDGLVQFRPGLMDDDGRQAMQLHDQVALLVHAPLATIDVGQVEAGVVDVVGRVRQRVTDLPADETGDLCIEGEALGLYVDLHRDVSCEWTPAMLGGFRCPQNSLLIGYYFGFIEQITMLNLNQLRCFWAVARAGGIHRASEQVHLTPQTLSGQISKLEATLGVPLFERQGRRLVLTETGRLALSYAEDIFRATGELETVLRQRPGAGERRTLFRVGIADVVPKSVIYQLLSPSLALAEPVRLVCREDKLPRLLAELAIHELDLVIADAPQLRGPLLRWLNDAGVHPQVAGEFEDGALMKAFGRAGAGVFPVPAAIADEVCQQFEVKEVGRTEALREQFYAITVERRLSHPATLAVIEAARDQLFAPAG
ncbi:MAG: LysR family transcriptional regulator [Moraxellaceae bacterium]|nr:LysR family transcriptional regulator [Moraxellaceae bacterium]